jgi:hypothetical protein
MLPNFIGLGAQKAGTTSLFEYLRVHPQVFLPKVKETNFFFRDAEYEKGISYYESKYFSGVRNEKAVGEISPDYLYHQVCTDRIRSHFEKQLFIIVLRNPVERAFSNYLMEVRRGNENLSFEAAIATEEERIQRGHKEKDLYSYVHRGFYFDQIKAYMDCFQNSQFLIFLTEDLKNRRLETMARVFQFLGVDDHVLSHKVLDKEFHQASKMRYKWLHSYLMSPHWSRKILKLIIPNEKARYQIKTLIHQHNVKQIEQPKMKEDTRRKLVLRFKTANQQLHMLLGRDLSHWNE